MGCTQSAEAKESDGGGGGKPSSSHSRGSGKAPSMHGRKGVGHTERMGSRNKKARLNVGHSERMGRGVKMAAAPQDVAKAVGDGPELDAEGHMTAEEVEKRITCSAAAKQISLGNKDKPDEQVTVDYAFLTQRGYYPDELKKANQDKYSITHNFAGIEGDSLFVVYDGHGRYGHDCAEFAKKRFPKILAKHIRQERTKQHKINMAKSGNAGQKGSFNPKLWPMLNKRQYEAACRRAHAECNRAMHADDDVDDTLSGTTLIAASFHDGKMIISNVGDSRAVLGHRLEKEPSRPTSEEEKEEEKEEIEPITETQASNVRDAYEELAKMEEGTIIALPLSRDQTPYRDDERERVKKAGARVMTIDMMEGLEPVHENFGEFKPGEDIDEIGDPPRIWRKDGDFPGTAFTRSLGDTVAESIGVIPDPEIVTRKISNNDKILVLASDGVFEFLPSQTVIDICADCFEPLEACKRVVAESYKKWLHYELRTDDITVIVIFIHCDKESSRGSDSIRELLRMSTAQGQKPIKTKSTDKTASDASQEKEITVSVEENGETIGSQPIDEATQVKEMPIQSDPVKEEATQPKDLSVTLKEVNYGDEIEIMA